MNTSHISEKLDKLKNLDFNNTTNFYPSNFKSHVDELDFLTSLGFPINPFNKEAKNVDEILEKFNDLDKKRGNLPYPIDGLVVKLSDNTIASDLGVVGKTPRAWCAMKFAAEEASTRLLDIIWQVGRTGKLTPVACLEDTELAGTMVKRATLHNYKEVLEKGLHRLDTLIIRKAGDIIPEVVSVLTNLRHATNSSDIAGFDTTGKSIAPTHCPSCETVLSVSDTGVDLICSNVLSCPDQVSGRLVYFCQRNMANIPGLSDKIIEKLIQHFGIHDIYDLYSLPWEEIEKLEGFGKKSVENLQKSIENSKHIQDYRFLAALGIDGLGPEVAKLICDKLNEDKIYDN